MAVKMVISSVFEFEEFSMVISSVFEFEEFSYIERLKGFVNVDNKASQRVMEKTGFQKEGVLRNISLSKGRLLMLLCVAF